MRELHAPAESTLHRSLAGFCATHSDLVLAGDHFQFIRRRDLVAGKPSLISGGGFGFEPMHIGFVGQGMLDAACPGPLFAAPSPGQVLAAAQAVETGGGVLLIVPNFAADVINFEAGGAMAHGDVETVIVDDGVAPARFIEPGQSRCIGGIAIVEKIVGAAAERGMALADLAALGHRVNARTRSMGMALGDAGNLSSADGTFVEEAVAQTAAMVLANLAAARSAPCLLLVNGFGGTPLMALYQCCHLARLGLQAEGIVIARSLVGSYGASRAMAGFSLTLCALDAQMHELWVAPVATAVWRWGHVAKIIPPVSGNP